MDSFKGKVAVITGAASGIGLATARRFAREGMKLVLADMNEKTLADTATQLKESGADVLQVVTDVSDAGQVDALADSAWKHYGAVHVLMNNAGVSAYGLISELTHADWEWSIRVNLWGVIHGVNSFLPRLLDQGLPAHIVNTSSFAGLVPNDKLAAYCAAKYGVVGLSECLYREMKNERIDVSILCPMIVRTNVWQTSAQNRPLELGGAAAHRLRSEEEWRQLQSRALEADEAADILVRGMQQKKLFIFTHPESREFIRKRFARIENCFD